MWKQFSQVGSCDDGASRRPHNAHCGSSSLPVLTGRRRIGDGLAGLARLFVACLPWVARLRGPRAVTSGMKTAVGDVRIQSLIAASRNVGFIVSVLRFELYIAVDILEEPHNILLSTEGVVQRACVYPSSDAITNYSYAELARGELMRWRARQVNGRGSVCATNQNAVSFFGLIHFYLSVAIPLSSAIQTLNAWWAGYSAKRWLHVKPCFVCCDKLFCLHCFRCGATETA